MGRNFRANSRTRVLSLCVLAIACNLAASGCDNDRTGRGRNDGVSDAPVRIAGTVQANQVEGATVVASTVEANGTVGAVLGQAVTQADGRYTLALNAGFDGYSGPVYLTATGGTYTSEGTGNGSVTLNATFSAVLPSLRALDPNSGSLPQNANITILTTLAAEMALRATGGISEANVNAANAAIQNAFGGGFNILETELVDPTTASSDPVSAASADYTLISAAFAQLAADQSQTETAQFNKRIGDIIDGRLDGKSPTINPDSDSAVVLLLNRALARFVASARNARTLALSSATQTALNNFDGNVARDTVPGLDVIAPKIAERFPVPGSTSLPLNTRIFVKADEELNPSTVSSSTVVVSTPTGVIPGTVSYDSNSDAIVFIANNNLPASTRITVSVSNGVTDVAGNPLSSNDSYNFLTGTATNNNAGFFSSGTLSPSGPSAVTPTTNLVASFDRALDPSSLAASGILTLTRNGQAVPFKIGYELGTTTFTITPTLPLTNSSSFNFFVSANLLDTNGNVLGSDLNLSFNTAGNNVADITRPTVSSISPSNGATGVQRGDKIVIRFSEAMNASTVLGSTVLEFNSANVPFLAQYSSLTNSLILTPSSPLQAGGTYTVKVSQGSLDLAGNALLTNFSSSFTIIQPALSIITTTLPNALVNNNYAQNIVIAGGIAPLSFSITTGSLPNGLSLNPSNGQITGTPTATGTNLFTVTVTDSDSPPQSSSQMLSITVDAAVNVPTVEFVLSQSSTPDETTRSFGVSVRLNTPSPLTSPVNFTVTDTLAGTATSGADYSTFGSQTIAFPTGAANGALRSVFVGVLNDMTFEGNETVTLQITGVTGANSVIGGTATHTVTIVDDGPVPTVSLNPGNNLTITEGGSGSVSITVSNPTVNTITVPYTVQNQGTTSDADHSLRSGTFTVPPLATSATIPFSATDDIFDEEDVEIFTVTLGTPSNATLGNPGAQTFNINDNDVFPTVSIASLPSIDEASGTATFIVSVDVPHQRASAVTVNALVANGSAMSGPGGDFTLAGPFSVSFAPGQMTNNSTVIVPISDDTLDEDDESFSVTLQNPDRLTLSFQNSVATGTIVDNDNPPNVSFSTPVFSVGENQGPVTLTITLDNTDGSGKPITVPFTVAGTANNPADHDLVGGSFPTIPATTFAPGQSTATVTFNLVDDNVSEGPETVVVTLGTPTNAGLGANSTATVTINDDQGPPALSMEILLGNTLQTPNAANNNRVELQESAGVVTVRARLTNPSAQDITTSLSLTGQTTVQPPDVTDLNTPGNRTRLYVGKNNGSGEVEAYTAFNGGTFNTELQATYTVGSNENVTLDTRGNLYQIGDSPGVNIRVFTDIANRPNGAFDPNRGDRIIVGGNTGLVQPKGLDVDSNRERILVADFGGFQISVFDLNGNGNIAPLGTTSLQGISGITGKPWDLDYDGSNDRLYIAMTDGNVLVYDNYLDSGNFGSTGPNRTFAPAFDNGNGPAKDSANLHGIIFNEVTKELYLSDVGAATQSTQAGFDSDGKLFIIENADVAGAAPTPGTNLALVKVRVLSGIGVRLGNPVDIAYDGDALYVSEKTSSVGNPADTNSILIFQGFRNIVNNGPTPPTARITLPAGTGPESITVDPGQRRDHNLRLPRTLTIPAGMTSVDFKFTIDNDARDEDNELISLSFGSIVNGSPGAVTSADLEIQNDDVAPTLNITTTASVTEGTPTITVLATLTGASSRAVSSSFATNNVEAIGGAALPLAVIEDYLTVMSTPLVFSEGETYKTITITINDDDRDEVDETFTVDLSSPTNGIAGNLQSTITIVDNDNPPTINLTADGATTFNESVGTVSFTATLDNASGLMITADVSVTGISPSFGAGDFTFPTQSLTFAPGETTKTVTVTISDDDLNEINEQFSVDLAITGLSPVIAGVVSVTNTITDNDTLTVTLAKTADGAEPSTSATFTATLNRVSEQTPITFNISALGNGIDPTEAGDITAPGTVTFSGASVMETVTVMVNDDTVNEATESFELSLALNGNVNGFSPSSSVLAQNADVTDNDLVNVTLVKVADGAEPTTNASFTATLSIPSEQTITFSAASMGVAPDPTEQGDITTPGSVTFAPLAGPQTLVVTINDDDVNEATESFTTTLTLTSTTNNFDSAGSTFAASATVTDNDVLTLTLTKDNDGTELNNSSANFTATLNRQSELTRVFTITAIGSGPLPATLLTDFDLPANPTITFAPLSLTASYVILVNDDPVNEANEQFTTSLMLSGPVNGFDAGQSTLSSDSTIADDDPITVNIVTQAGSASVAEGAGTPAVQTFEVQITPNSTEQSFTVNLQAGAGSPISATLGTDFTVNNTSVSFTGTGGSADTGPKLVTVNLTDDMVNEASESYTLTLTSITGGTPVGVSLVAMPTATATILDDDIITVNIGAATDGAENNSGAATDISYTVSLNRLSEQTLSFSVASMGTGNDPAEGTDFMSPSTLTFAPGTNNLPLAITVVNDGLNENNEQVQTTLALTNVVNNFDANTSIFTSVGTIIDDDDVVFVLSANAATVPEGNQAADNSLAGFTVTLSGPSELNPVVTFMTATTTTAATDTGDATPDVDFTALTQDLTFTNPSITQTVNVELIEDTIPEQNENFAATIALNGSFRGVTIQTAMAQTQIIDEDAATIDFVATPAQTEGSGQVTVNVMLNGPKSGTVTVDVVVDPSTVDDPAESSDIDATSTVAGLYISGNGTNKVVERVTPFRDESQGFFQVGNNEGIHIDADGNLFQAGDIGADPSIRFYANITDRANNDAFNPLTDRIIRGSATMLANPKGIDVDTNRGLIFVADNGAQNIKVFRTTDVDNVAPQGTTPLMAAPWDLDYDTVNDRLFVAMTNGELLIYDNYVAGGFATSGTVSRTIIVTSNNVKDSTNLHGIVYNAVLDEVYVTDVGAAGDPNDGRLYVLRDPLGQGIIASNIGLGSPANLEFALKIAGSNTRLGNPVDLAFDGTNLIIAEKANDFGVGGTGGILTYNYTNLPGGVPHATLNRTADVAFQRDRPESVAPDVGRRRDTDFNHGVTRTLTFVPGDVSESFSFKVLNDTRFEGGAGTMENLVLRLNNATAMLSTVGVPTQTITIEDDDVAPSISLTGVNLSEGNTGTKIFTFTATLDRATQLVPTGDFTSLDGVTANPALVSDNDYTAVTGSLSFVPGQVFQTFTVEVVGDIRNELDEDFLGQLSNITIATPATVTASATIINDDGIPTASVALAAASQGGVVENSGDTIDFVVSLNQVSGQTVTVNFNTLMTGTATSGTDFTAISAQTVSFAPGITSQTVSVTVTPDTINEANETVVVMLDTPNLLIIGQATATGTINDDDDITISIADATLAAEGTSGSTPFPFTLTLSGVSEQTIQVSFSTNGTGNAIAGTDYIAANNQTASFAPSALTTSATVQVTGDELSELNETFGVMLGSVIQGRGVTVDGAANTATGTITDDDAVTVTVAADPNGPITEGGTFQFPVTLNGSANLMVGQTITVSYSVTTQGVSGDPTEAGDITGTSGTLTFTAQAPGTVVLTADIASVQDMVNEANESFIVRLDSVTGNGVTLGATTTATGTVNDNDDITIDYVQGTTFTFVEDVSGALLLNLTKSGATEQSLMFSFNIEEDGSPNAARGTAPNRDFMADSGTRTITQANGNVTLPVSIDADVLNELSETFRIRLSGLTARGVTFATSAMTTQSNTVTITDDDGEPNLVINTAASDLSTTEDPANSGNIATVQIDLAAPSGRDVTFQFNVNDGATGPLGATSGGRVDYTDADEMITIPAGQTTVTRTIMVSDDTINEADETFSVQITSATGAIIAGGTQTETVTIVDNDAVTLTIDSPVVTEVDAGATNNLTFTVTLSGDTEQILTVDFASTDGTARNVGTNQGDYETQTGTTTFDGQASFGTRTQTILLVINGDDINEPTEDLRVTLTNPVGNLVSIAGAQGFGRIADNDPLEISIASAMVTEGAPNSALSFPVTFNRLSEQVIILNVAATAGTPDTIEFANAGPGPDDVGQIPALVTFSELTPSQNLVIPVIDDNINEANETITITLTINGTPDQVSFATGADVATGTINDDDNLLVELTTSVTIREDRGTAPFPVQITDVDTPPAAGMTEQMIGVVVATADSTAGLIAQGDPTIATDVAGAQNSDYQDTTQNILFQMGTNAVLFNVPIANETTPVNEGEETFEVTLVPDPAVNGGVLPRGVALGTTQVQGIITDDDFISITVDDLTQSEATTTFNFNVNLNGFTEQNVMVLLSTELGGPVPATQDDFTAVRNTITFAPDPTRTMGQTRTIMQPVTVIDDVINEANQTFLLSIINGREILVNGMSQMPPQFEDDLPQGISAIPSSGTGTISDDDAVTFTLVDNNATAGQVDEDVAGGNAQFILRFEPATITTTEQNFMINFRANNGVSTTPPIVPATTPEDFAATNMNITIGGTSAAPVPLGDRPLTVGIVDDMINEANEDFSAELRNLQGQTNGVMAGTPVALTIIIMDNDVFILGLRSAGPVTEASPGIFEVFVDTVATAALPNGATGTRQAFTFDFSTADLATAEAIAAANRDYTATTINGVVVNPTPQFIIFNPNQVLPTNMALSVPTTADAINEANERFNGMAANLMAQGVFFVGSTPPGTIIASIMSPHSILDDDAIVFEIASNGVINETDATMTVTNAFSVTTTGATSTEQTFTVPYMFNPNNTDTAVDPNDYSIASITALSFTGTSATAVTVNMTLPIDISIVGDDINERFAENFQIMLGAPTGTSFVGISVGANGTATQVINDDDVINFAIVANPTLASEATTARPFELTLAAGTLATSTEQTFNIDFATMDGTATSGTAGALGPADDFAMLTQSFMFTGVRGAAVPISLAARGAASRATVTVQDEEINEANETFMGTISAMNLSNINITGAVTTATILDDDAIVLDITAQSAVSETATSFVFTIADIDANTVDTEQSFFVLFDTRDDVATAGDDFVVITDRQLDFSMGTLSRTVTVTLTPDSPQANMGINEANETFIGLIDSLTANPSARGVTLDGGGASDTATGTINDDDALDLTVQFGTPVSEGDPATNPALPFTIVPTGTVTMTQQNFTVDLTFTAGTATVTTDFTPPAGNTSTVTIPTNVAINVTDTSVTIVSDEVHELDETVISMIGNVSAGAVGVTASGMATGIIDNDDLVLVRIEATTTGTEADANTNTAVNVTLVDAADGTTAATSQVDIIVGVGNVAVTPVPGVTDPAEAGDFSLPTTATVTAGNSAGTFNVNVVGDDINEANELLRIVIANNAMTPADVTVDGGNNTNNFTINDDDDITVMYNAGTDGQTIVEGGADANYTYTFGGSATSTEQAIDILVDADGATTATAPGNANNDYLFIDENNVVQNTMQIVISTGPDTLAAIGRTYRIRAIDDGAGNDGGETYTLVLTARLGGGASALGVPVRGLTVQAASQSVSGTIND